MNPEAVVDFRFRVPTAAFDASAAGAHGAVWWHTRTTPLWRDDTNPPASFYTGVDGAPVPPMPPSLIALGQRAVAEAYGASANAFEPDAALINFYDVRAHMGMHQDKDEKGDAPVVSLSLGNRAIFRFGNATNRNRPYTDIELVSGDLFVFGGPSRFAFHGITKTLPGTADPALGIDDVRWNITLRQTGLTP